MADSCFNSPMTLQDDKLRYDVSWAFRKTPYLYGGSHIISKKVSLDQVMCRVGFLLQGRGGSLLKLSYEKGFQLASKTAHVAPLKARPDSLARCNSELAFPPRRCRSQGSSSRLYKKVSLSNSPLQSTSLSSLPLKQAGFTRTPL